MTGERIQSFVAGAAFLETRQDESDTVKLTQDRYEIYVNNEFVGYKALLTSSDHLNDVDDFLKQQGVNYFSSQLDGDHYHIQTEDASNAREVLTVYCHNR